MTEEKESNKIPTTVRNGFGEYFNLLHLVILIFSNEFALSG